MHAPKQRFFENQPRHLGVVFLFEIRYGGKDAMRFSRKPDVRGLKWFAHLNGLPSPGVQIEYFNEAGAALLIARETNDINVERPSIVAMLQAKRPLGTAIGAGTRRFINQARAYIAMQQTTRQFLHSLPQSQGDDLAVRPIAVVAESSIAARRRVLLLTDHAGVHGHVPYIPSIVTGVRSTICCAFSGRGLRSMRCHEMAVRSFTPKALANFLVPTCLM